MTVRRKEQQDLERIAVRWREGLKVRFIFLPLRDSPFAGTASQPRSAGSSSTSTGKLHAPPSALLLLSATSAMSYYLDPVSSYPALHPCDHLGTMVRLPS
ncbi:unnamed protein product [Tetraodon nigroviridis]|uniref:(spotted green pufferfish) hypothetical protein n=1 Tax=Tetraodon nigroviridis TaxID=99883 RepID=Q4SEH5_TETNG|nr:unnamed protein product [Tetraodon nigroviridis]